MSKFGLDSAEARQAVRLALEYHLPLNGLHFHIGSQINISPRINLEAPFTNKSPLVEAILTTLDFASEIRGEFGWSPSIICVGGGLGVAYHEDDLPHPSVEQYVEQLSSTLVTTYQGPLPRLQVEPGRSLIARAGVCLYRVGAIKKSGGRRWILVDGGLADNPRHALYNTRYSCLPVSQPDRPPSGPAWMGGPYCESGDTMFEDLPMPEIEPGEILAVPVSGAYHLSMSSNYNGACRPAVIWVDGGETHLIQARETPADLLQRDQRLPHIQA